MNFRPLRLGLPVLILSAVVLIAACSSDEPDVEPTASPIPQVVGESGLGETVSLGIGESTAITGENIEVAFHAVFSDSRCPAGAQCVTAGTAHITLSIQGPDFDATQVEYQLSPGLSLATPVGPYTLSLISLEPDPPPESGVSPSDYRVSFSVAKN